MKRKKQIISIMVLSCMLLMFGITYADPQYSYATLSFPSVSVKGNNINGGDGTLSGALTSSGGTVEVAAYKVVAFFPDPKVTSFQTSSTRTQTLSDITLDAYENLFYVRLTAVSGAPSAWGQLKSVH